jgi:hypothetical protein
MPGTLCDITESFAQVGNTARRRTPTPDRQLPRIELCEDLLTARANSFWYFDFHQRFEDVLAEHRLDPLAPDGVLDCLV